jgi:DegV family protein with EDD domain
MSFKKIRIVIDSCADVPAGLVQKHQLSVVPLYVNYDGKSFADDGIELDRTQYYKNMPTMTSHPTTAAPPSAIVEEVVKRLLTECDHVVMLTIPAKLSAVYNAFRLGTESLPQDRLSLVDSTTLTMGVGYQAIIAAEVAEQTGDVNAVLNAMERVRKHVNVYAAPETMEYLRKGGRVSWAVAGAASLLQIKPVIQVKDSEISSIARVRTMSKVIEKVIELGQFHAPLERVTILHANNLAGAEAVQKGMAGVLPADLNVINVSPVLGTHIGPGSVGVATLSKAWKS